MSVCRSIPRREAFYKFLILRRKSTTQTGHDHFRIVVAGGGAGGCAVAARACRRFGKGEVAVIEPAKHHYYQPMWTLVGGGAKTIKQSRREMKDVLPSKCVHFNNSVKGFEPDKNLVVLNDGKKISYDYLVIALGIKLDFNGVDGLVAALKADPMVCSNYDADTVGKTWPAIQKFEKGNAVFTFPNTPLKCPGAPQKIMYLAEAYWKVNNISSKTDAKITYNTPLPVIFSAPKYAEKLMQICEKRNIKVNFRRSLKSIDHTTKTAVFELLDKNGKTESIKYDFIHVTPPQSSPDAIRNSSIRLSDVTGFLDVHKHTMQHKKFQNIFGLGDCTNLPTPRTAAAVAGQNEILFNGLLEVMDGKKLSGKYQGYTSCPLVTGNKKCIMAEFDYTFKPVETFPFDQGKERRTMYQIKAHMMPHIYWKKLLNGKWGGPKFYRNLFHLNFKKQASN